MKLFARVLGVAFILAIALTFALATPAFAAGGVLNLLRSTPEAGTENVPIENVGIKLFFDGNVTAPIVWEANSKRFTLTDSDGNPVNYDAYAGQKEDEEGYILVIARPTPAKEGQPGQLVPDSAYALTISGDLESADGATLGSDIRINFKTMDVASNSRLSMIMMVVMMVGVIALMFITNWRKMKAEAEAAALAQANPYRVAKEKGITVDDAKALIEKAREKNKKALEKTGGKAPEPVEKKSSAPRLDAKKKEKKNTHKVKGPRPVSEGGSSYKTGRKAEKERKAKAVAAKKAASGQQKGVGGGANKGRKNKGKKK